MVLGRCDIAIDGGPGSGCSETENRVPPPGLASLGGKPTGAGNRFLRVTSEAGCASSQGFVAAGLEGRFGSNLRPSHAGSPTWLLDSVRHPKALFKERITKYLLYSIGSDPLSASLAQAEMRYKFRSDHAHSRGPLRSTVFLPAGRRLLGVCGALNRGRLLT